MNTSLTRKQTTESNKWRSLPTATVGKDILELLSSSMYIDPLTIYREYVQNAVDAIDEARDAGQLHRTRGSISISIDLPKRTVRITDDGFGVRHENFESQLGTFGGSQKRGSNRRGFRGVGRLAGLGYCQELTFRTRAAGDSDVSEMRWDCRKIKHLLSNSEKQWTLEQLLNEVVSVRTAPPNDEGTHFFEVEMRGVIRHRNDVLLNRRAIYDYLSEVAPVPFHPNFSFGAKIEEQLTGRVAMGDVEIRIEGENEPVYRPYQDTIEVEGKLYDQFVDLEFHELPAQDEGEGAAVWLLHHGYKGTIPDKRLRGIRARCGNVQIGGSDILSDCFPEPRFNGWTVGEVHVFDRRIVPNGRRDHFELGVHFENLVNYLTPLTRKVSAQCRKSSQIRNRLHEFQRNEAICNQKMEILRQNAIGKDRAHSYRIDVESGISRLKQIAHVNLLNADFKLDLEQRISTLEDTLYSLPLYETNNLMGLSRSERKIYEKIFSLIYEYAENDDSARKLVDRLVTRIS